MGTWCGIADVIVFVDGCNPYSTNQRNLGLDMPWVQFGVKRIGPESMISLFHRFFLALK